MAAISRARTISAEPQEIWAVLADFGAISAWADNVDHSCLLTPHDDPVGTARRLQVGRNTLVERITEFDPPRALSYAITGLPPRLRSVVNRWTLTPADGATVVTLTSTVEVDTRLFPRVAEALFARVMAKQSESLLDGLANRWESARV